jgi:hypothetical protein
MATEGRDWIDITVRKEGWQETTKEKVVVSKGHTAALPKKVEVRMDRAAAGTGDKPSKAEVLKQTEE